MEFILVPVIFSAALLLLSIGKLFGRKGISGGCKSHSPIHGVNVSCGACAGREDKLVKTGDHAGLRNIAQLGYPGRNRPFIEHIDFKPDQFN